MQTAQNKTKMQSGNLHWWLAIAGLVALFGPTYRELWQTIWQSDEYSLAPLIALISSWLFWRNREKIFVRARPGTHETIVGWIVIAIGLMLQIIGRSQNIPLLEILSQIPLLAGLLLIFGGISSLRAAWFPIVFLLFMVPLPGILVEAMTSHLKQWVSQWCEQLLYLVGLPVARNGVVISIGPYQMMVADACSGLYSMFSLSALGVLFTYLVEKASPLHRGILLLSIVPIAILTNLLRVLLLVLVTYFFGDGIGRWMHAWASPIVFVAAVVMLFSLNLYLNKVTGGRHDPAI